MTYEEALERARVRLLGWEEVPYLGHTCFLSEARRGLIFTVANLTERPELASEGWISLDFLNDSWFVVKLEDFFKDPFNVSIEEAAMFQFEYGFNCPEELINDV